MKRNQALEYVGYWLDDALSPRSPSEMPDNAKLVGWQCGFEPMFGCGVVLLGRCRR